MRGIGRYEVEGYSHFNFQQHFYGSRILAFVISVKGEIQLENIPPTIIPPTVGKEPKPSMQIRVGN